MDDQNYLNVMQKIVDSDGQKKLLDDKEYQTKTSDYMTQDSAHYRDKENKLLEQQQASLAALIAKSATPSATVSQAIPSNLQQSNYETPATPSQAIPNDTQQSNNEAPKEPRRKWLHEYALSKPSSS
jgi:CRISPR/Cas system-associated endonuclease/helicase Cas3